MESIVNFELDPEEEYDKFCGKVFTTTKNNIVFHCTLCEKKFGFETYITHVKNEHIADCDSDETSDEDNEEVLPLEENEFPISTLQKKNNISVLQLKKGHNINLDDDFNIEIKTAENLKEAFKNSRKEDRSRRTPITPSAHGTYNCPHCSQRFQFQFTLRQHLKEHDLDRIHKCSLCGVQFKKEFLLRQHLMRHDVEKRHKCNECDRSFVMPSELRYHQRKHNGEKPYQCESCGIKYAYKSTLRIHRKRHHTHQRDYPCPLCSKSFYTSRHLRDHMSKHTNEATYKCEKCDRTFKHSSTFQRHKAQHRMQEEAEKNNSFKEEQPDSTV